MSKRETASLREYAAAEDRLLDLFSPPSGTDEETSPEFAHTVAATSALHQQNQNVVEVDPSRDNMLQFISDDSEIRSLLASSESNGFKGFDDELQDYSEVVGDTREPRRHSLIFGMCRNPDNFIGCPTPKRAFLSPQIASTPIALLQAATSPGYILTNGNINGTESEHSLEEQVAIECQNVIQQSHTECVIYDNNVVLLTDEQCCEIIVAAHGVHTDQEVERAYLMGLQPVANEQEQLNNDVSYSSDLCPAEEDEEASAEPHVYLSDAALDRQYQQQQLLLDAAEEDANQVSDSFVDDRPDICEVYDHELEDQDDDCAANEHEEGSLQLQLQQIVMGQQQLTIPSDVEEPRQSIHASDVGDQQGKQATAAAAAAAATAAIPHSSTTEFPVSSTSMPNGSDYDDYDDELGTAEMQSPPLRKYMPLLKNTLSAEAVDRRLANICQSQPQMSLSEKMANWNCAHSCEAVEDVENFEAVFEQHEAEPAKQPKFSEFCEILRQDYTKITQEIQARSVGDVVDAAIAPDTPYSSEDAARQKRPCYRRLLHTMPVQQTEVIVLDDDDEDDDDCYEVTINPSTTTLVPRVNKKFERRDPVLKTTQTQTNLPLRLETKETSTTDLGNRIVPSEQQECNKFSQFAQDLVQPQVGTLQQKLEVQEKEVESQKLRVIQQQQQEERQPAGRASSVECNNDAQFSEQHEFCNYLGLTELATANAVASAMRELANSNVARRSLRVRTQQQLDRMRSDVRGKRRERQQQQQHQQQREQQPQENSGQRLNGDSDSSSSNISNVSGIKKTALSGISAVAEASSSFEYPRPSAMNAVPVSAPTIEYYYHAQCGEQQNHHSNTLMVASDFHQMSLEAAFAKVYAAAAPAQNELHECMQSRLRQARETKPSIYIVKALNNAPAPTVVPSTHSSTHASPERLQYNKKPEQAGAAKLSRKTPKKLMPKASKRRRTTVGVGSATAPHERELVTRSTTHMNSKLLRNRKVNLLKSYELSDAMAQGRGKRLSGGSTPSNKRLNTPKVVKKSLKKSPTPTEQVVISHASSQQHRPDQQQPSPKPKKSRAQPDEQKVTVKRKRLRAKSLPSALNIQQKQPTGVGDTNVLTVTSDRNPNQQQQTSILMDTHEFITNHAAVSPPLYSAAVRRYVNAVCNPKEQQSPEHQQQQQQLQPQMPEGFYDLSLSYAQLAKPSLMYPPLSPPPSQRAPHFSRRARQVAGTNDNVDEPPVPNIQITPPGGLLSLTKGSTALRNPLAGKNGKVLYIYYELDQLIVLQEKLVSFWKYSKVFNVLQKATTEDIHATATQQHAFNIFGTTPNQNTQKDSADSDKSDENNNQRWIYLGGTRRITNDIEIVTPHCNRMCAHNSTPVYIEMRSHPLDHHKRESKLLSLYVNVYYYCEEELRPKMHSVHLDAVNCEWNQVIYTSIAESRYFVMAWQQELVVGKPRAGICKYSLTPTLDTLASIREFKQLRHELRHIECLTEDRLIGYGHTRITIWDHRSGDTLMNYDFGFNLGQNLGVMHFPSFDIDQSSMLVLYQHVKEINKWPELRIIACELSHATPTHRVLHVHRLPSPHFDSQLVAINTGDHLILKSPKDDEIWINVADPRQLTYLAPQDNRRFYTRQKSQIITMTPSTLTVDSIANHVLKLATAHQEKMMIAAMEVMASAGSQLPVSV
ncbi:uncharacterized protein LOC135434883 [Drosophila montana]|uniref:uncharacterized protein LOC135434883 n=1 Tax=Drosophila montana TaxID=40370 RepID=UPI00313C6C1A